MHDLVIRGGTVVDGTGAAAFTADVAIDGDRIAEVGDDVGRGTREVDAGGLLVTPGWVDVHTHYDGQATWDPHLTPSGWHGVTTIVMGNCGVGFAPAAPDQHEWLIGLMEGVEDIPGTALAEGITWEWESFPEYLDALERMERTVDVGAQVPHGAVRAYVMGERGARNEEATVEDLTAMAAIVREGLEAGGLGFSTSRTILHRASDGELVPGTRAPEDELFALGEALGDAGHGVFELTTDFMPEEPELDWIDRLASTTGQPVTFVCLQNDLDPGQWRRLLAAADRAAERGVPVVPQVGGRTTGLLMSLESTTHPLMWRPAFEEVADLPIDERVARMRDPEVRQRIVDSQPDASNMASAYFGMAWHKMFSLGDPPDYEPPPERSVAAVAEREGRDPADVVYDLMMEADGKGMIYFPILNYADGSLDPVKEMLEHPASVLGLSDGGAHCGLVCDASLPTFMLTHWVRDRERGERLGLEQVVKTQTRDTAKLFGLDDRGALTPGWKADVNLIDFDALAMAAPVMVHDLPAGGRRLIQRAEGYRATILSGRVVSEDGEFTDERPGTLIRGPRPGPA